MIRPLTLLPILALLTACPKQGEPPNVDPVVIQAFEEEVTFEAEGLTLEGTLHVPTRSSGAALPGVVLIHGSGPNGRDESATQSFPGLSPIQVDTFVDLAEGLAAAGFVVLRYDKRTCGTFNGLCDNGYPPPPSDVLVSDFMADAGAALDYLGQRSEVDAGQLVAAGHSQGASFVPILMASRDDIAAGLMLAGPYRPIYELLLYQAQVQIDMLLALGMTQEQAEAQVAAVLELAAEIIDAADGDYGGERLSAEEQAFWLDWLQIGEDAIAAASSLQRPIRAVSGSWDIQVPPEELEAWADLLGANDPDPGHQTELHDCATHQLNCVRGESLLTLSADDVDSEVLPELIEGLIAFLNVVTN